MGKIELIFKEIIAEYPQKWSEFTSGKKGLAGFFMGELMKKTSGKSNPKEAMEIGAVAMVAENGDDDKLATLFPLIFNKFAVNIERIE